MNLAIHTGRQAIAHVTSKGFREKWLALYDACPWATAFQHPDFVVPWYELYQDKFLPVVVVAEAAGDGLTGLLTLALQLDEKQILVGAGERQAEYHAWLEKRDTENAFICAAVRKLRNQFPTTDLYLKYLPPDLPLDWIAQQRRYLDLVRVRPHRRPLMKIDGAEMERQRRKKNHRQNFNRLKRSGDVSFEKIEDHDRFLRVLDDLCMQYDFRQGALHHYMPFASDPAKKPFYIELHKRGLLHTSVLSVGDEIAASHSGLVSKGSAVHLGINTHGPAFGAHSPGLLLLAMLGVHLVNEQLTELDLTPGGDGYKEQFATGHDVVNELIVYGGMLRGWRAEAFLAAKRVLKRQMQKAGMKTADAWAVFGKISKARALGIRGALSSLLHRFNAPARVYRYRPECAFGAGGQIAVSKNSLHDIMLFVSARSPATRWEFFRVAMGRMERAVDAYSYAQDGKLLLCCWAREGSCDESRQGANDDVTAAEKSTFVFDLYVHHSVQEITVIQKFITQVLSEIKERQGSQSIYFIGALNNMQHEAIKKCGFIDEVEPDEGRFEELSSMSSDLHNFSIKA